MLTFLNYNKMIKVAFLLNFPLDYKGGINYLKNLFYATHKFHDNEVEIILFVSSDISIEYINMFSPYCKIIRTKLLKRNSLPWFFSKVGGRLFNWDIFTYNMLAKHDVNIISHSNFISPLKKIKTLNWIPDFQYIHYSDLWTDSQLKSTKDLHSNLIKKSDAIVLSSHSAFEDYKINHLNYQQKVKVLNFVSQPDQELEVLLKNKDESQIRDTYNLHSPFFYMPNQFWSHKNHKVVFEAVKMLRNKGFNPLVVTSGLMSDYRNGNNHVENLQKFVSDNSLNDNILFLGLIPYNHVIKLILMSKCIINPSFFEGWSSTVEEAKTFGKRILLSNIPVHIEQAPEFGVYFDPNNILELSDKMEEILKESNNTELNVEKIRYDLDNRTKIFASEYYQMLTQLQKDNI
jgi:glycosyltransferase involved in cell wall biosynthesis